MERRFGDLFQLQWRWRRSIRDFTMRASSSFASAALFWGRGTTVRQSNRSTVESFLIPCRGVEQGNSGSLFTERDISYSTTNPQLGRHNPFSSFLCSSPLIKYLSKAIMMSGLVKNLYLERNHSYFTKTTQAPNLPLLLNMVSFIFWSMEADNNLIPSQTIKDFKRIRSTCFSDPRLVNASKRWSGHSWSSVQIRTLSAW